MPARVAFLSIAMALFVCGQAAADARHDCIAKCEATAQACFNAAHAKYDACKPAANKGCAATPPADKFKCLTTALKACTTNRTAETGPCRAAFDACYATCGPRPADQADFWCTLDADSVATTDKVRTDAFCTGEPGRPAQEQLDTCIKKYRPTDPAMGYSLECEPLP